MSRFVNVVTGVTFTVSDEKNERYAGDGYRDADAPVKAPPSKPSSK